MNTLNVLQFDQFKRLFIATYKDAHVHMFTIGIKQLHKFNNIGPFNIIRKSTVIWFIRHVCLDNLVIAEIWTADHTDKFMIPSVDSPLS